MKRYFAFFVFLASAAMLSAQKKPLDHSVYDNWKTTAERMISNDGNYVVYVVNPQEGDGELVIQNPSTKYKKIIPRGYNAVITEDSRYLVFKIKPFFQETRQARIKKKKPDDMPKDSVAVVELGKDSVIKIPRAKNYKTPEKGFGYIAYQLEKPAPDTAKKKVADDFAKANNNMLVKLADSLIKKSIDSIRGNISKEELSEILRKAALQIIKKGKDDFADADGDEAGSAGASEGADLVLRSLTDGKEIVFKQVTDYLFDKKGTTLLVETGKKPKDSSGRLMVLLYSLASQQTDTIFQRFNDSKNYVFDEDGRQLAFVAERDSSEKALTKFYKLWYFKAGADSAMIIADKNTVGMQLGFTVSENATLLFNKRGDKLFFGNAPVRSPKDTTLVEFETAKLDVWSYTDDYLQPQQLKNLSAELNRSYTAVYHLSENKLVQLGAADAENVSIPNEGNAGWVLAQTTSGNRAGYQWTGRYRYTTYIIDLETGQRKLLSKNSIAGANVSPEGKFVYWYDPQLKNYFTYEPATGITKNVSEKIKMPLYEEDNDVPDFADNYGVMGWGSGDSSLMVYDQYEIWKLDPMGKEAPVEFLSSSTEARKNQVTYRYIKTDKDERFIRPGQPLAFKCFDNATKWSSYKITTADTVLQFGQLPLYPANFNNLVKAKEAPKYIFTKETFQASPDIYYSDSNTNLGDQAQLLSDINPQQKEYNWGTAELFTWKAYNGKTATGIVYKPENYDPKKKYPLICYFYEKLSDGLFTYIAPAPTPSRLNISFFVSRGYIVLAPDIVYTEGHPGNSAYNYIASGARALAKIGMIDSTKIGIQGQSWGGYQVAYLITKTKLFVAAWAGAPVANMTSAYGGIRWESGLNRQFQYEKQQSRLGATLWEKPQLYIENSPLFHLPAVQTPLVIMHNDADGAVPWYQGIELFTGLKRLGKPVWMLNYNGEAHNIMERRNRKDIQIREQQFFDWMLKGEKPARWLTEGVPATEKGKNWGLQVE